MYSRLYSNENLLIYGDRLHLSIHTALKEDTYILDKFMNFFNPPLSSECIKEVTDYILRNFARLRGVDIIRRIMFKCGNNLKLHTRQTMAALSDSSLRLNKKCKTEEMEEHIIIGQAIKEVGHDKVDK